MKNFNKKSINIVWCYLVGWRSVSNKWKHKPNFLKPASDSHSCVNVSNYVMTSTCIGHYWFISFWNFSVSREYILAVLKPTVHNVDQLWGNLIINSLHNILCVCVFA